MTDWYVPSHAVERNLLEALPQGLLEGTRVERIQAGGNPLTLKEQKGFDVYLERKRRRVVEDGKVYEFSHAEVAHQKEKERRHAEVAHQKEKERRQAS